MDGERYFEMLFEYAPLSLWEQDFSAIKARFDDLRSQGVLDLEAYLDAHPEEVEACMQRIEVKRVNLHTLAMYGVQSNEELWANLPCFFRDEMRHHFRDELLALWNGQVTWAGEGVNYTLSGQPIDILLSWRILPGSEETWEKVLVAIEDISQRKQAERALRQSEQRLHGLFEHSPISLWEEDYSQIKAFFNRLRREGVEDFEAYLDENPETVDRCMGMIRVLDVNRQTLELFKAKDKQELLENLPRVFRDEMRAHFRVELLHLWSGELTYKAEGINYALDGEPLYVRLHLAVFPGCEETFERVLVALEDVTERRKAEEYLRYLGTHDVLTGLYNRAYFQDELKRLSGGRYYPISILIADLDDLKKVNDTYGHEQGDNLIRCAAEVLRAAFRQEDVVARIGGDEFAVLLPRTGATEGQEVIERIETLVRLNNKFYGSPRLSLSVGISTGEEGEALEGVMRRADDRMYRQKRRHKLLGTREE